MIHGKVSILTFPWFTLTCCDSMSLPSPSAHKQPPQLKINKYAPGDVSPTEENTPRQTNVARCKMQNAECKMQACIKNKKKQTAINVVPPFLVSRLSHMLCPSPSLPKRPNSVIFSSLRGPCGQHQPVRTAPGSGFLHICLGRGDDWIVGGSS